MNTLIRPSCILLGECIGVALLCLCSLAAHNAPDDSGRVAWYPAADCAGRNYLASHLPRDITLPECDHPLYPVATAHGGRLVWFLDEPPVEYPLDTVPPGAAFLLSEQPERCGCD